MNRKNFSLVLAGLSLAAVSMIAIAAPATEPTESRVTTPSGLTIIDLGRNELVSQPGDSITVHYTGKLENGTIFDTSLRNDLPPFTVTIGQTRVIAGWTEGLVGLKVGDKRQLIIPANLGYGEVGSPPTIPPNATLTFDIEVLRLTRPEASEVAPDAAAPIGR